MPRRPKLTFIDQRLAAAAHKRQVVTITKAEEAAAIIESIFRQVQRKLLEVITSDRSAAEKRRQFAEVITDAIADAEMNLRNRFKTIAGYAQAWMVRDYLDIIPRKWLAAKMPPQVRTMFEGICYKLPKVCLSFAHGEMSIGELAPLTEEDDYWEAEIAWFEPTMWVTQLTLEETERDLFGVPVDLLYRPDISDDDKRKIIAKVLFPPPSEEEVQQIINQPMRVTLPDGSTNDLSWQDRLESLSHKITDKQIAFDELVRGYAAGENVTTIRKRLEPLVAGIKSSAQRIARTEGLRVAERIQRRAWEQLGDMMEGVQILAVLDQNTRPHHAKRNGTIYYKDPNKANGTTTKPMDALPDLPDEPNCRCWTTPVLTPPPELKDDPKLKEALATTAGAGVPDPASYEDWWRTAREPEKKIVVGVKRYELIRQKFREVRLPEFSDFVDEQGRLMPVSKLAAETEVERQARKQQVRTEIERRKRLVEKISERGFDFPKVEPTRIPGITFSREVDPTSQVDLLGETIRANVKKLRDQNERKTGKPDLTEKQVRKIGRMIAAYTETPDIQAMASELGKIVEANSRDNLRIGKLLIEHKHASSKAEKQKLSNRILTVEAEIASRDHRLRELSDKIAASKHTRLLELLQSVRDFGTDKPFPEVPVISDNEVHAVVNEVQRFYPSDWLSKMQRTPLRFKRVARRGYYNGAVLAIAGDEPRNRSRSTAVHELWHVAQQHIPEVSRLERELYNRRTKKSKKRASKFSQIQHILHGTRLEMIRRNRWFGDTKDGFGEYMGRDYGNDKFFEIGTMGIEGVVFHAYPIDREPEVRDFVLGLLVSL